MELPQLVVELVGDYSKLMEDIKRARVEAVKQAQFLEKDLNLTIGVNDKKLSELNKHFDLKVTHFKQTQTYFKNNPLKVYVNDNALTNLNKELDKLEQRKVTVNVNVNNNVGRNNNSTVGDIAKNIIMSPVNMAANIAMSPFRVVGKVADAIGKGIDNIAVGFTEEIGRNISRKTTRKGVGEVVGKIQAGFKIIDEEIIGKSQVYETFLAELLRSGQIDKAFNVALKRTTIHKYQERLGKLQILSDETKTPQERVAAFDQILKEEPALQEQFNAYRAKFSQKPEAEVKRNFIPTVLDAAQPTAISQKVVMPLINEFQPLLRFIQGMQSYNTSVLSQKFYNERKPAFPILGKGENVVSVFGGAEDKKGQGGRILATALEPLMPGLRFMPVENLDTDATERTAEIDKFIKSLLIKFAPDLLGSSNTITNSARQVAYSLNPLASSVGAAQALAYAKLAKEQGMDASALSFSLGGADAYRYAKTAEYEDLETNTLAMAYPFLNFAGAPPKNFKSVILDPDPLTFPFKLGINNPTPEANILKDTTIPPSADAHGVHHLFKSPQFRTILGETTGVMPVGKSGKIMSNTLQDEGKELQHIVTSIHHSKATMSMGAIDIDSVERLSAAKSNLRKYSSKGTEIAKFVAEKLEKEIDEVIEQIKNFFKSKNIEIPDNLTDLKNFSRYISEINKINNNLFSFKTGQVLSDDDAHFAGGLNVATVAERKRKLQLETLPWFQKQDFGEYSPIINSAFENLLQIQDEFVRTEGKLSPQTIQGISLIPLPKGSEKVLEMQQEAREMFPQGEAFHEENVRLASVPAPDSLKKYPATILAFNKMVTSLGEMMPDASEIKTVGFGMSGAAALMTDSLVYKTDLDPDGAKKIASEQEIKAYEKLQGRFSPLLYAAKPGEALVTERVSGKPMKDILEELAKPVKDAQDAIKKESEESAPLIKILREQLRKEKDSEKKKDIRAELGKFSEKKKNLEKKAAEERNRFNDIAEQLYVYVGQLGGAMQEMGVAHNDLASGNVFFDGLKIDSVTNKVDPGKISSIDLGNSIADPNEQQERDDRNTTFLRAVMDRSYFGILNPIKIYSAINKGYSKPLPIPEVRQIDPALLTPEKPATQIPIGYSGRSMLQEITGALPIPQPVEIPKPPRYVRTPVYRADAEKVSESVTNAVNTSKELAAKFNASFVKLKSLLKDAEKTGNFTSVIEFSRTVKELGEKAKADIAKLRDSAGIDPNFAKSRESSQLNNSLSQITAVQNKAAIIANKNSSKAQGVGIGENIGAGVSEGIKNSIKDLRDTAEKLADIVPDVVTKKLKIQSPSEIMMGYGENTGDGYGIGLDKSLDRVKEIAESGIDDVAKTFDFVSQDPMNPREELTSSLDDWYLSHRTPFDPSKLNNILSNGLIGKTSGGRAAKELELFGQSGTIYSALRNKQHGIDYAKNEFYGAIEFLINPSRIANKTTWFPQDSNVLAFNSIEKLKEHHRQKGLGFRQLSSILPKASLMKNYEQGSGYVEAQTHAPVLPSDISAIRIGSSQISPDQLFKKYGDSLLAFIRTALSKNIKVIGDFSPGFLKAAESAGINISKKPSLSEAQQSMMDEDEFNKKLAALQGTGKNVGGGLSNGIDNSLKNVKSSSEKLANTVINTVEEKLEIKSPSRWGIRTGQNVVDAMGMGAEKSLNKFKTIIASKISEMKKGIEGISPTKFNYTTFPSTSSFPILPTSYKPSKTIPSAVESIRAIENERKRRAAGMINGIPDPWNTPAGHGIPNIVSTNQKRVYPISPDPWSTPQPPQNPPLLSYTIPGTTRSGTSPRLPNISSFPPAYLPPQVPQSISFPISNTTPRGIAPQLPPFLPNGIPQVPQSTINAGAKKNSQSFVRFGIMLGKYVGEGFTKGLQFLEGGDNGIIPSLIRQINRIKASVENGTITSDIEKDKERLSRAFSKGLGSVPGFKEAKERFKGYMDFLKEIANPNVSAALGENLANGIVAAKELFVDFLKMPEKIKEGFNQAKVAFNSFVEGMNKVEKFGDMMDFLKSSISNVVKVLALLVVGKIILDLAPASIEVAANFENLERRIKFTSGSISEGAKNIAFLRSEAKRLNVDLSQTLESGSKFLQATKDTPIEGYQSRQIVSAVTQASAVYGLDLDKQQRTFTALEQMSGKTVVSQEELRQQLAEAIPNASQIAANAYGTTTQSMNQLLSTGRVLAEDFLPKFAQQLKAQTSSGVGDAVNSSVAITNKFNNSLIELQESIGKILLPFRNFSLSAFASGIDLVTKNSQLLRSILLVTLIKLGSPVWLMFAKYLKQISFSAGGAKGALLGMGQSIATLAAQIFILSMTMQKIDEIMMNFKDNSGAIGEQTRKVTQSINEQRKLLNPSSKVVSGDDFSAFRERFTLNPFDNSTKKLKKQMEDSAKRTLEGRENTKNLLDASNSPAIQKAIRDIQFLDKALDNIKMERRAVIANDPGNSEALRNLQEWEKKVSKMREKPLELVGGNKAILDKQVETLKTYLEYWEELKKNPKLYQSEIEEIDKIIKVTKEDLATVTKEQDKMTKAIKNSLTEMQKFAIEIRNLEAKFNDLRQSRDTALSLEKTKLFNLGSSGSIQPGQIEYTNNLKTQENLIGKIADNLKQIQEMSDQLKVNGLGGVLDTLSLNKGSGIDALKAAQERAIDGSKEKEILSGFIKVKEMQIQTVDMQQQIAEQKYNLTQSLYQQTKQVADYYRAAVRESQAVGIEFEKAQKTLENPKVQNRLREALIGAGDNIYTQFIEGIINVISQTTEIEKQQLEARKQRIDYQNNIQDIQLQAVELQRSLPGKIIPIDSSIADNFNLSLKNVNSTVDEINKNINNLSNSVVDATKKADDSIKDLSKTSNSWIEGLGTKFADLVKSFEKGFDRVGTAITDMGLKTSNWLASLTTAQGLIQSLAGGISAVFGEKSGQQLEQGAKEFVSNPLGALKKFYGLDNLQTVNQALLRPTPGRVTSNYGMRIHPTYGTMERHNGVDFGDATGTPIKAPLTGTVITSRGGWNRGAGNMVEVETITAEGKKVVNRFFHLSQALKKAGDVVQQGDIVGKVGSTGRSTGAHLHWEVMINGQRLNPMTQLGKTFKVPGIKFDTAENTTQLQSTQVNRKTNSVADWPMPQQQATKSIILIPGHRIDIKTGTGGTSRTGSLNYKGENRTIESIGTEQAAKVFEKILTQKGFKLIPAPPLPSARGDQARRGYQTEVAKLEKEKNAYALELHFDNPKGGKPGVIPGGQYDPSGKYLNQMDVSLASKFGAFSYFWGVGGKDVRQNPSERLGATNKGITILELDKLDAKLTKLIEQGVKTGDFTDFEKAITPYAINAAEGLMLAFTSSAKQSPPAPKLPNLPNLDPRIDTKFLQSVATIAQSVGAKPEDLLKTMLYETGGTLSPSARNPRTKATGLIQFMPATARGLGTNIDALAQMSPQEQLVFVQKYLKQNSRGQKLDSFQKVLSTVFAGNPNASLGVGDGDITLGNYLKKAEQRYGNTARQLEQIVMQGGSIQPNQMQEAVTQASRLKLNTADRQYRTNQINSNLSPEQIRENELRQRLEAYRLIMSSQEKSLGDISGTKDSTLGITKTVLEGLSPNMSNAGRFSLQLKDLRRKLEKDVESLQQIIRETDGAIAQKPDLQAAFNLAMKRFPNDPKLAADAIQTNDLSFKATAFKNAEAKKNLAFLKSNIDGILKASMKDFDKKEFFRLSEQDIQQQTKVIEQLQQQLQLVQKLKEIDPLNPQVLKIPSLQRDISLLELNRDQYQQLLDLQKRYYEGGGKGGNMSEAAFQKEFKAILNVNSVKKEGVELNFNYADTVEKIRYATDELTKAQTIQASQMKSLQLDNERFAIDNKDGMVSLVSLTNELTIKTNELTDAYKKQLLEIQGNTLLSPQEKLIERLKALRNYGKGKSNLEAENSYQTKLAPITNRGIELGRMEKLNSSNNAISSEVMRGQGLFGIRNKELQKAQALSQIKMDFEKEKIEIAKLGLSSNYSAEEIQKLTDDLNTLNELKLDNVTKEFNMFTEAISGVKGDMDGIFKDFFMNTKSFGESISAVFQSILNNLANMASKELSNQLFSSVLGMGGKSSGGGGGGFGGIFSSLFGGFGGDGGASGMFSGGMDYSGFLDGAGGFDFGTVDLGGISSFAKGGMVGDLLNKERAISGFNPRLIIANEGERVLTPKEAKLWNQLNSSNKLESFSSGGMIGEGLGNINNVGRSGDTINITPNVNINNSEGGNINKAQFEKALEAKIQETIKQERRPGGSLNRGGLYDR